MSESTNMANMLRTPINRGQTVISEGLVGELRFVEKDGERPSGSNVLNLVVIVPAETSGLGVTSYGVIRGLATIQTSKKRTSKRLTEPAWTVHNVTGGVISDHSFVMKRSLGVFPCKARYLSGVDSKLYQFGRIYVENLSSYVQATEVIDEDGTYSLRVQERGSENDQNVTCDDFDVSSDVAYVLNYAAGLPIKSRHYHNLWASKIDELAGTKQKASQLKPSARAPVADCTLTGQLEVLDEHGEPYEINVQEFIQKYVLFSEVIVTLDDDDGDNMVDSLTQALDFTSLMEKPVEKNLYPYDDRPEDFDLEGQHNPVHNRVTNGLQTIELNKREPYSKTGVNLNQLQKAKSNAILNTSVLAGGKWHTLTWESRACFLLREEQMRPQYDVNKTTTLGILCASIGILTLSYYTPNEMVPCMAEQPMSNAKWDLSDVPKRWIKSMAELVDALRVVNDIARLYYRQDVSTAINYVHTKAHEWVGYVLPQQGVNGYRDLTASTIVKIIDSAATGTTGFDLLQLAMHNMQPSSLAYATTITDRITRINAAAAWNGYQHNSSPTPLGQENIIPGGGIDREKKKKVNQRDRVMTDELLALIPPLPAFGGKRMCLKFKTQAGCKTAAGVSKTAEECNFAHTDAPLPLGIKRFTKGLYGRLL